MPVNDSAIKAPARVSVSKIQAADAPVAMCSRFSLASKLGSMRLLDTDWLPTQYSALTVAFGTAKAICQRSGCLAPGQGVGPEASTFF